MNPTLGRVCPLASWTIEGDFGVVYPLDYQQGIPAWAWSFLFLPMGVGFLVMGGFDVRDWKAGAR